MNVMQVGNGHVELISGGGKVYTDVAARFTRTERNLDEILASPYNAELVRSIVEKGHLAATDWMSKKLVGSSMSKRLLS